MVYQKTMVDQKNKKILDKYIRIIRKIWLKEEKGRIIKKIILDNENFKKRNKKKLIRNGQWFLHFVQRSFLTFWTVGIGLRFWIFRSLLDFSFS